MQNAGLIREVRGVMTRFEPLTEEIVAACTQDGLTYAELSDALSAYGLSIEKVMHDPTRKIFNTCYADYDLGLYADIILQREFIRGPGQAQFQKLARQGGICRTLAEQDWRGFYLKDVPLSMLIYDFQRRYKTIPHETVFSVWHGIYKRIDYANGMWSLPVSTHLPLASSAASIGKGYPFRKMRRIFSCWENPKPFCVLSLNIPSEKRLLLHFVPHYIQHRTLRFCQSFEKVFEKTSEKPIQNTPQNVSNPIDIH